MVKKEPKMHDDLDTEDVARRLLMWEGDRERAVLSLAATPADLNRKNATITNCEVNIMRYGHTLAERYLEQLKNQRHVEALNGTAEQVETATVVSESDGTSKENSGS